MGNVFGYPMKQFYTEADARKYARQMSKQGWRCAVAFDKNLVKWKTHGFKL